MISVLDSNRENPNRKSSVEACAFSLSKPTGIAVLLCSVEGLTKAVCWVGREEDSFQDLAK